MIQIDMPMPDNCVECRFNVSEFGYCNAMPVNFCGQVNDFEEDGRPEWCPLKAQEPRVMTLDELSEKTDVWFESLVYDTIDPALSSGSYDDGTVGLMTLEDELFYMDEADYGTKWRCWTSCPDQATREATPWE